MPATQEEKTEVGSYFISNYPPFSAWRPEGIALARGALERDAVPGAPLGLYIHIPYCRKRCKFCYFRVYTDRSSRQIERYLGAVSREVQILSGFRAAQGRPLRFVYFGGGTPSYLSEKQLSGLVEELKSHLPWSGAEEVTFECEPGTLNERKIEAIREIGVTRLSLGVENFSDAVLEENGRAHRSAEILRAYGWARRVAFPQINIDLIAGMVGDTWENWQDCVRKAMDLAPDSLTIYQMELPFNAVYAKSLGAGEIRVADWKTKRAWVDHAFEEFTRIGYGISSAYTLVRDPSARFVYRDALWHGADMLGTGVASFSHLSGVHYQNLDKEEEYLLAIESGTLPLGRAMAPTPRQLLIRSLVLQLKLGRLDPEQFRRRFGTDIREEFREVFRGLREEGSLEPGEDAIALTRQGLLRVDALLPRFFEPTYQGARYT